MLCIYDFYLYYYGDIYLFNYAFKYIRTYHIINIGYRKINLFVVYFFYIHGGTCIMISAISKKITLYLGFMGLLVAPLSAQCDTNLPKLKELCTTHNQIVESSLCNIMHELETSLAYWHTMEDAPFSYAIIRGPKGWISSKTAQDEIQSHIEVLGHEQEKIASALGCLAHYQVIEKSLTNPQDLKKSAATCFELVDILLEKIHIVPQDRNVDALITYGAETIKQLPEFHDHYLALIADHLKPNHFIRHWTKYALGTACILAASAIAYTHQDELASFKDNSKAAIYNFWKKNIKEPISNTYNILFDKKHTGIVSNESLEGKRTLLRQGLREFLQKKLPEASTETIDKQVEYMMSTKDIRLVQEDLKDQFGSWGSRAYSEFYKNMRDHVKWGIWTIAKAPDSTKDQDLRVGQDLDLVIQQGLLTADELLQKTQLNLELFAIIPSILGLYGLKKGYDSLFHRKILSEPLQQRLIYVDKLLNKFNHGTLQLDLSGTGFLRYHVHALSQYVGRVPAHQQKAFKADLEELNNQNLNVSQKLRVIDQMYRQYAFLNDLTA